MRRRSFGQRMALTVVLWTTNLMHCAVTDLESDALILFWTTKVTLCGKMYNKYHALLSNRQQMRRIVVPWKTNMTLCCYWQQMRRVEVRGTKKSDALVHCSGAWMLSGKMYNKYHALRSNGQQIRCIVAIWTTNMTHCYCYWQRMRRVEVRGTKEAMHWFFGLAHGTMKVTLCGQMHNNVLRSFWQRMARVVVQITKIAMRCTHMDNISDALWSHLQQISCVVVKMDNKWTHCVMFIVIWTTNVTRSAVIDNECDALENHGQGNWASCDPNHKDCNVF